MVYVLVVWERKETLNCEMSPICKRQAFTDKFAARRKNIQNLFLSIYRKHSFVHLKLFLFLPNSNIFYIFIRGGVDWLDEHFIRFAVSLCWNETIWLVENSHMTSINQ